MPVTFNVVSLKEKALRQQEEYRKTMKEKEEKERIRQERERLR